MLIILITKNYGWSINCVPLSWQVVIIQDMNGLKSELGQFLRDLRNEREETLHQITKGIDIDSLMLSKFRGRATVYCEQLKRLAN